MKTLKDYLEWRCRVNWIPKYHKYIQDWISNVTESQAEYFSKEKDNLIKNGKYYE